MAGSSARKKVPAGLQPARAREFEEGRTRGPSEKRTRDVSKESLAADFVTTRRGTNTSAALPDNSLSGESAHCYEEGSSRGAFLTQLEPLTVAKRLMPLARPLRQFKSLRPDYFSREALRRDCRRVSHYRDESCCTKVSETNADDSS